MSRASNLAGFVPSIEPTNNLTVGNIVGTSATFTGNVSVGGTLTYEDVTNVDSVGLITARSGINVTGGSVVVSSGNLSVSGIVTASSFVGAVTGDATGLTGTPNLNVGVVTATSFVGPVTGTATGLTGTPNLNVGLTTVTGLSGVAYAAITSTGISKTLINREYCTVTTAGVTITLPASPQPGWEVGIAVDNFTDVVVARNGSNIMGLAENFTMDIAYLALQFVYVNSTQGWRYF